MSLKPTKRATGQEAELAKQVAKLSSQIKDLQKIVGDKGAAAQYAEPVKRYPRLPAWVMVREYLMSVGGTDLDTSITDALLAAGHKLGKYPLRTVMNSATSPRLNGMFSVDRQPTGNYVTVNPSFFYRPPVQRRLESSTGKPALVKRPPTSKR